MKKVNLLLSLIMFAALSSFGQFQLNTVPPLNGGNGSGGITFNLTAHQTIIVDTLFASFSSAGNTQIWYSTTAINGSPNISTSNGWVHLATATVNKNTNGDGSISPINHDLGLLIPAGKTYAFYIDGSSGAPVRYTTYTFSGSAPFTDGIITIETGNNIGYGGAAPRPSNHPRQFNGGVKYRHIGGMNDASVASIDSLDIICTGTQNDYATIANYGKNQIDSVWVNWEINGVSQTPLHYKQMLDTIGGIGSNTVQLTLGNYNFQSATDIKVYTSMPNGAIDTSNYNDTLSISTSPSLSGTYSIGGQTADYTDFSTAVADLKNKGVCAPVVFLVNDGNYNEQLEIIKIKGTSSTNTVTFASASGDSSKVRLYYSAYSSGNYVVKLEDASNFIFKGMGFDATATGSYARVFDIGVNCDNLSFYNNVFKGQRNTNSNSNRTLVYYSVNSNNQLFSGNLFVDGSKAIELVSSNRINNFSVEHNRFSNQYYSSIEVRNTNNVQLLNNYISTNSIYTSRRDIYLYECDSSLNISNNHIYGGEGGIGVFLSYCELKLTSPALIANNFIQIGKGTNTAEGIYLNYGNNFDVIYNTVNITSENNQNKALYYRYPFNTNVLNNNFSAKTGYAYYVLGNNRINSSDYNNFYSTTELAYYGGDRVDLKELQLATGKDSNSISTNPYFINDTNYVVAQIDLNNAGIPFSRVLDDIEGELRDTSTPDIGADEFTPIQVDAGIIEIGVPEKPFAAGSHPIRALVKNFGGNALSSFTLNWKKDGIMQSAVNWTGSLASGDTTWVNLGNVSFSNGELFDFTVFPTNPNGVADVVASNDTFKIKNIGAGLSGSYTIGGSSPDFLSFTEAVKVLNISGVYGAVVFNVRSGTYIEQINISKIPRIDSTHSIVFQSEVRDSSAVTVEFAPVYADNYVVQLNNTHNVVFQDLTFYANSTTSYGRVFNIDSGSTYIFVKSAVLKSNPYSTTSDNRALVYSRSVFKNTKLEFDKVYFKNGSRALSILGSFANKKEIKVSNCTFESQYYQAIFTTYTDELIFSNNLIDVNTPYNYYTAAQFQNMYGGGSVTQNKIYGNRNAQNGLSINSVYGDASNPLLVANNFVQIGGANSEYGVILQYCSYVNFVYNTVAVLPGSSSSKAFFHGSSNNNINIYNNIFQNLGGGFAFYSNSIYGAPKSDYNNLYTSGANLGYWGGNISDMSSWVNTSKLDSNSLNVLVQFVDTNDLHTQTSSLDGAAKPLSYVTTDIDGELRDVSKPDIGADEFQTPPNDAALTALQSPVKTFSAGLNDVKVQLYNNGSDTLFSTTIQWEINGVAQTAYNWTGSLPSGKMIDSITLGSFNFQFSPKYTIKTWVESPNGSTDAQSSNDTILVENLYAALQGIYTIGDTTTDFANFSEAILALDERGVNGWVNFNVKDGIYEEQLVLKEVDGVSIQDTILFQSESGDSSKVKLFYNGSYQNNFVVKFDGADYFSFKDITIQNTNKSYGRVIVLDSNSNNNNFLKLALVVDSVNSTSTNMAVVYGSSAFSNNYNSFVNCSFRGGSYGVYLYAPYLNAQGNQFVNSEFSGQYYMGMRLLRHESVEIARNTITTNSSYSSFYGMYFDNITTSRIEQNEIHSNRYGAYFYGLNGSISNPSVVANNFIYLRGTNEGYGIYIANSNYSNIVFNSVLVTNSHQKSTAFLDGSNSNTNLLNNILKNTAGGYAISHNYTYSNTLSDYNNLYVTGDYLGSWNSTNISDLKSWQSASQLDSNSLSVDVQFYGPKLHTKDILLSGRAKPLSYVTVDFDGEARDLHTPDIGADEYTPNGNDASLTKFQGPLKPFVDGNQSVYVQLLNNGTDTLKSVTINWTVNGVARPTYSWNGSLPSAKVLDSIPIGTFNFAIATFNDIVIWTSYPNNRMDEDPSQDTLVERDLYPALSGQYTIGGASPDFSNFTEAVDALHKGGVAGWVHFNVRDGIYQEQITINEISGVSLNDSVVFQSESRDKSLVSLTYYGTSSLPYTLKLDGSSHITFRDITFRGENKSYTQTVQLMGGTNNLNFMNCTFWVVPKSYSTTRCFSAIDGSDFNLYIINSEFINGNYGLYVDGKTPNPSDLIIKNNKFSNQLAGGLSVVRQESPIVYGNDISTSNRYGGYGAYLDGVRGQYKFLKNKIYLPYEGRGLILTSLSSTVGQEGLIANNFVSVADSLNANYNAVEVSHSSHIKFYSNSFLNDSASGNTVYLYYSNNIDLKNNNIIHFGTGYPFLANPNSSFISDYNNYYANGPLISTSNGVFSNLNSWSAISNMDSNSISVDPMFISARDLHVTFSAIDSAGVVLSEVLDDIDGELRDTTYPDIGADEVIVYPDDILLSNVLSPISSCEMKDSMQIKVRLHNRGSSSHNNFDIVVVFNNDTIRESINNSILGGSYFDYTFNHYFDFSSIQSYAVKVWSELPSDIDRKNDTLKRTLFHFPKPNISLNDDLSICAGSPVYLRASGGVSYQWNDGTRTANKTARPTDTTTYTVVVTDLNACSVTDSVTVFVDPLPSAASITAVGSLDVCYGDSLLLYASGASDIIWSTGETSDSIYVKKSGKYTLKYNKLGSKCDQQILDEVSINVNRDSIKLISLQTICIGDAAILTATDFVSGIWSTGDTTNTIMAYPASDSVFYVNWINSKGCQLTDSIKINVKPALSPAPVANMTPLNGTLNLQSPVKFSWAPAANAVVYDLYVWKKGSQRSHAKASNLNKISANVSLEAGQKYYWQVVGRNSCFSTFSDTMEFSVIGLPDLSLDSLSIPPSALSGTKIDITYTVSNKGSYTTGSTSWFDYIWLSSDEDLRKADDILLLKVPNLTYLDTGQSYTNTVTVELPKDIIRSEERRV